jgi:hypothetical protein
MNPAPFVISGLGELSPDEQVRSVRANELFQSVCEERGIRVSSWMDFAAWKAYVRGDMEEPELTKQVKAEIEDLAKTFGKYVIIKEEEPSSVREYPTQRERARLANKIYKKVCGEIGLTLCFFSNFSTWSDYVKGRISEAEFYERAKAEAEKMRERAEAA